MEITVAISVVNCIMNIGKYEIVWWGKWMGLRFYTYRPKSDIGKYWKWIWVLGLFSVRKKGVRDRVVIERMK